MFLLFSLQWCGGGDEDLWRWHGGRALSCGDVNELMADRVPLSFYSLLEVGFAFWVTPAPEIAFGPSQMLFGLTKWSRRRVVWAAGMVMDDPTTGH
jgi:hypothetical protein